ncbi:MAG: ArsR/SmtB family transcription factor [bacterium]
MSKILQKYEQEAEILKVLAHPVRLFIVDRLGSGPLTVSELHREIEGDMSTLSRHLSLLKSSGIVKSVRKGNQRYYHLQLGCALEFILCCRNLLSDKRFLNRYEEK